MKLDVVFCLWVYFDQRNDCLSTVNAPGSPHHIDEREDPPGKSKQVVRKDGAAKVEIKNNEAETGACTTATHRQANCGIGRK